MKAIRGGKRYDTEKAEKLAETHRYENPAMLTGGYTESLYRTDAGALFIHHEPDGRDIMGNEQTESIRILDSEEAQSWAEDAGVVDERVYQLLGVDIVDA